MVEGFASSFEVICWGDPINLREYVTYALQSVFGWPRSRAVQHSAQIQDQGRSILAFCPLERAEHYVHELQKYGLHATLEARV